jgi:3-phenylpropionate/trans-cinnamate dioxygenase ferredoxin reductase subunit
MQSDIVIIGAGHAGGMASILLRKFKYKGSITIIGDETYLPYQRPALSKGFLIGDIIEERLFLKSNSYYDDNKINILTKTIAESIDKEKKIVNLSNGKKVYFQKLILAIGSNVNKLDYKKNSRNLFYLRDIKDSLKIKKQLKKSSHVGIIGSGYIGLEIASAAKKLGKDVSIIEMEDRVMNRAVSLDISKYFQNKHEINGVKFFFNAKAENIDSVNNKIEISIKNRDLMSFDLLTIGIGIKPNTKIAKEAQIKCDNGIIVNEFCQTSSESIFAIGDCTYHPNKIYNRNLRLESVHNAVEQAKTVASYITGNKVPYNQVPWFWTEQYNSKLQIAGIIDQDAKFIVKGSLEDECFSVFCVKNKQLIAIECVNSPSNFMIGKKLIEGKKRIETKFLQDNNFNLKKFL